MRTIIAMLVCACGLAACGGGGGGSSSSSSTATPASIDNTNQAATAQDSTSTAFMPMLNAQALVGAQTTSESVLFSITHNQLNQLPTYLANAKTANTLAGAVYSQTLTCSLGGSLTVSVNDADSNGVVSAGDSVSITANSCVDSSGTLTGSLSLVVNSLSGAYGSTSYSAGITLHYGNLTVTASQVSASINGSLTLSSSVTGTYASTDTISTPSLTVSGTYSGVTHTRSLTNYSATATTVPDATYTALTSYSVNGTLTSSALSSHSITFATTTPFVRRYADAYPSSGVMVITGANNSKLRITALSNTQVQEDLDANGDGTYESSSIVNWNTLM